MGQIEHEIEVAAAPEAVWEVLVDLDRLGEWVAEHRGFPDGAPSSLREGTTYRQTLEAAAGQEVDVEWTVTTFEPPSRLAFDGDGPAGSSASLRYAVSTSGDGSRVAYATSFDLPGGPLGKVVGKAVEPSEDDARATLERLKALVEG